MWSGLVREGACCCHPGHSGFGIYFGKIHVFCFVYGVPHKAKEFSNTILSHNLFFAFFFVYPAVECTTEKGDSLEKKAFVSKLYFPYLPKHVSDSPHHTYITQWCVEGSHENVLHWHFERQILFVNSSFAVLHYIYYTRAPTQGRCAASLRHGLNRNWELLMFFFEHY